MKSLSYPLLALSGIGSLAILSIHVAALLGFTFGFDLFVRFLVPGLFVVWLPSIFVMNTLTKEFKQKEIWRAALRGCPPWMRRTLWIVLGYAWVGFFTLPFFYGGGNSPLNKARSMLAVLMVFYMMSFAVFYSATHAKRFDGGRYCLNGHRISPLAKFCEECGAPAAPSLQGAQE
jgi:hypothetical protein